MKTGSTLKINSVPEKIEKQSESTGFQQAFPKPTPLKNASAKEKTQSLDLHYCSRWKTLRDRRQNITEQRDSNMICINIYVTEYN